MFININKFFFELHKRYKDKEILTIEDYQQMYGSIIKKIKLCLHWWHLTIKKPSFIDSNGVMCIQIESTDDSDLIKQIEKFINDYFQTHIFS